MNRTNIPTKTKKSNSTQITIKLAQQIYALKKYIAKYKFQKYYSRNSASPADISMSPRTAQSRRRAFINAVICSGGVRAVKEPGHFEVRKSSSQVTRMHFFPQ